MIVLVLALMAGLYLINTYGTAFGYTSERAKTVAMTFIKEGPTFRFDGVEDSVKVERILATGRAYTWEVHVRFECLHSGYGDRTGKVILPVITSHLAKVVVERGRVVSAIIDDKWDELDQTYVE